MKTDKEELGEELISRIVTDFMNNILFIEKEAQGEMVFDNLDIKADLKDGRVLRVSLKQK